MNHDRVILNLLRYASPSETTTFRGCASTCSLTQEELSANEKLILRNAAKIAAKKKDKNLQRMLLALV